MAETFLFVGGPRDGERINLHEHQAHVRFPVQTRREVASLALRGAVPFAEEYAYAEYRREHFHGNTRAFTLYVFQGLTADDVVQRLLDGYGRV